MFLSIQSAVEDFTPHCRYPNNSYANLAQRGRRRQLMKVMKHYGYSY